ncbi:hypothetical protein [Pseudomonas sp. P42]|uniref:hypothetical protein n=1 Tax=Pseudomonas sp. P42 TaxID=1080160 RepID=UPI001B33EBDA|nr:hypothetical protein [Pseudomonas sp. P42]MBP5953982.1 hypothetical protein [Pseudomonas sp. P42]
MKGNSTKAVKSKKSTKKEEKKVRDDFLQSIKNQLREMCGGICSNPDCRVYTFGPTMEKRSGYSSIGVAAHITAAAPGAGARRYNADMTADERSAAANGIWLCQSCSKLIDTDEARFPIELLKQWKFVAEKRAMELIGKTSIGPDELQQKLVEAVASASQLAYTSMGNFGKAPLSGFVRGYENYLSQLDPRFVVKTTAKNDHLSHEISVKPGESAKIKIRFKNDDIAREANQKWKYFLETGEGIELNTNEFEFVGSALFEIINQTKNDGVFVLEPHKTAVPSTLYLRSLIHDTEFELASFDSYHHSAGEKLFIVGDCLGGLLSQKCTYNTETLNLKIDYNFNPEKWIGSKFSNIDHLPKLLKAVNFLKRDVQSRVVVEFNVNGNVLSFGESTDHDFFPLYEFLAHVVQLIDRARTIAAAVDSELRVLSLDVSPHDERLVNIYSEILRNNHVERQPLGKEILTASVLKIGEETVKAMNDSGLASYLKIKERCGEDFNLLGNLVTPPIFQSVLNGFEAAFFTDLDSSSGKELGIKVYAIEGTTITHSIEGKEFRLLNG